MAKILVTADLHLREYDRYNSHKNSRLHNYVTLAEHMNATIKERGITHAIIAGDLLDHSTKNAPIVYHTLYDFLETLSGKGEDCQVLVCHGNHDCASKFHTAIDNVYYPLIERKYEWFKYLHNQSIEIDGKTIYFRGWEKEFNDKIPACDILIGHYCVPGAVNKFGLEIAKECPKSFKTVNGLAIFGDIHKHQFLSDKVLVPGVPMQNNFNDEAGTGYCIVDTDDFSFERVSTADEEWTLKFLYDDDFDSAIYRKMWKAAETDLSWEDWLFQEHNIAYKEKVTVIDEEHVDFKALEAININEILSTLLEEFPYKDELFEILGSGDKVVDNFINQEVKAKLLNISVQNFQSIEDLTLDFTTLHNPTIITGLNGSGKSTIIEAIIWTLTGKGRTKELDDVIQEDKKFCEVILTLEYQGNIFRIERSRGTKFEFQVYKNNSDKPVDAHNKEEMQKKLEDMLPIISKLHLLYFNQSRDGLLSELNDSSRIGLISELSGQSLITEMSDDVYNYTEILKANHEKVEQECTSISSKLEGLRSVYKEVKNPEEQIDKCNKEIESLRWKIERVNEKRDGIRDEMQSQFDKTIDVVNLKLDKVKEQVVIKQEAIKTLLTEATHHQNIADKKLEWECPTCGTTIKAKDITPESIEKSRKALLDIDVKKGELEAGINEAKKAIQKVLEHQEKQKRELKDNIAKACFESDKEHSELCLKMAEAQDVLDDLRVKQGEYRKSLEIKDMIRELTERSKDCAEREMEARVKYDEYRRISKRVFGESGLLSAAILEKLSRALNVHEDLQIHTTRMQKNGVVKPTLDLSLKVRGKWRGYRKLSGGERLYADVCFVSALINYVGGIGWLIFDESFKYFDPEYRERAFKKLATMPCHNLLLVYHGVMPQELESYSHIAVVGGDGSSEYTITNH